MKKKAYVTPEIQVIELTEESCILTMSGPSGVKTSDEEITGPIYAPKYNSNVWADDEEEE